MPIHDPQSLTAECDRCGTTEEIETTSYSRYGLSQFTLYGVEWTTLNEHGWTTDGEEVFCKQCSLDRQNEDE